MRIDKGIHLLASGRLGCDLTDPFDCNVYAFDAGDFFVAFDSGAGIAPDQLLSVCADDGIPPTRLRHLFLTHGHADHAGGAASLSEATGATVHAGPATARLVSTGDEAGISLAPARAAGIYPADYRFRPCPVADVLAMDAELVLGHLTITPIPTPGHSHDHVSYLIRTPHKTCLLTGDALFFGGTIVLQDIYDCSIPDTLASIRRLATLSFDALLPGHLTFSLRDGRRHVDTACEAIAKFRVPPSIV